ncbi:MAG TPA: 50S ribosomal protein L31 [Patescibacteria group bacterium]|nr:50S ribosomal protein L31 [Patescibacteria group bacterium]
MKTAIHPMYYPKAKIVCACGNVIEVGSTVEEIHVELCSKCHPFYTGKQKLIDTSRRVEKFQGKVKAKEEKGVTATGKKVKAAKRAAQKAAKKAARQPTHLDETQA